MNYLERLKSEGESKFPAKGGRRAIRRGGERRVIRDVIPPPFAGRRPAERSFDAVVPKRQPSPPAPSGLTTPTATQAMIPQEVSGLETRALPPSAETPPAPTKLPPSAVLNQELPIRTWEPEAVRQGRRKRTIALSVITILAAAGLILPTFVFPKFSITIYPKTHILPVSRTELVASTAISTVDTAAKKIPGLLILVEKTLQQQYPSSGTKFIRERAQGKVKIFNAYSSSPQTLVAGTRLQDSSGNVFRLNNGIIIPGAGVAEGKIVPTSIVTDVAADAPGERYNIGPTEFRIPGFRGTPKYQGFYAKSETAFQNGFEGQAKIILADDLKRASEDITQRLVETLRSELSAKIPSGQDFLVPAGGRETAVLDFTSPKAGERFDRFPVSARGRGKLFIIRRSQLWGILSPSLLPTPPAPDTTVELTNLPGLVVGEAKFTGASDLNFAISGHLGYYQAVDTESIRRALRTTTPQKAEVYLKSRSEIESFRIKRFPGWLWFIPRRSGGLDIRIQPPA